MMGKYSFMSSACFCCQAEDGIRYLVRSRGLGDVYKRQPQRTAASATSATTLVIPAAAISTHTKTAFMAPSLSLIHI